MTSIDKVNWGQQLMDEHAVDVLNIIYELPISDQEKLEFDIKIKELVHAVAKDSLNVGKEICLKSMQEAIDRRKTNNEK